MILLPKSQAPPAYAGKRLKLDRVRDMGVLARFRECSLPQYTVPGVCETAAQDKVRFFACSTWLSHIILPPAKHGNIWCWLLALLSSTTATIFDRDPVRQVWPYLKPNALYSMSIDHATFAPYVFPWRRSAWSRSFIQYHCRQKSRNMMVDLVTTLQITATG